jgi:probable rRNA maturation factor
MLVSVTTMRDPEPLDLSAFERLGLFVLTHEEVEDNTELSVAIVPVEEMADLNMKYRGVEGPTDVLSFGCDDVCTSPGDEPFTLGDVIIAPEVALAHASEFGTTPEAELNLLLVHGILHLLGYDHEADADADVMQAREKALLAAWADLG